MESSRIKVRYMRAKGKMERLMEQERFPIIKESNISAIGRMICKMAME